MASPARYSSRYRAEQADEPPRRIGMSDYTSQRLAELRARRAEMELDDGKVRTDTPAATTVSPTASTTSPLASKKVTPTPRISTTSTTREVKDSTATNGTAPSTTYRTSTSTTPTTDYRSRYRTENTTSNSANSSPSHSENRKPSTGSISSSSTSSISKDNSQEKISSYIQNRTPEVSKTVIEPRVNVDRSDSKSYKVNGRGEEGDEFVGFSSLPEQVHRKAVKRGFDFTLMVVGETGLGKSTLINSLFLTDLYKERKVPNVEDRIAKTVAIDKKFVEFEERGVRLRLTIVDTPGFNDSVDANECWQTIESYINQQCEQYLKDEMSVNRRNIKDNRVHCCLYFVSPYGHGLKQMDIQFMRRLHDKVNIVPVIAKADTLTQKEIKKLKERLLDEIDKYKINIYEFPDCDSDEDEDFKKQDQELKSSIPFAVIGSNTVIDVGGKKIRGRQYPWGIVEVDNPKHCDFIKLRQMLISTHMQDLKEVTKEIHYENFRARQLERSSHNRERVKLKRDSRMDMEGISEADKLLQQKDDEIRRMQEMLVKMQSQLSSNKATVNGLGNL